MTVRAQKRYNASMKKLRGFFCFAVIQFCFSFYVFASPHAKQDLVPAGHWLYDALTALSMEMGNVSLADQAPMSVAELDVLLSEVDYEKLSSAGKLWYDKIMEWRGQSDFSFKFGEFSVDVRPETALELYGKTNDNVNWVYDRYDRKHLLDLSMRIQASDWVTLEMQADLATSRKANARSYVFSNVPYKEDFFDTNFPHWAYTSAGFPIGEKAGVNVQMGIGALEIGRSLTGSIIWSSQLSDLSFANIEFFSPAFRYTMNVSQFNVNRYMYSHRFDFRLFKLFHFSIMESLLVYAPLELRFLLPFTVLHGQAPWRDYQPDEGWAEDHIIMDMTMKIVFTPFKYTRFYFYYAQTENQCFTEDMSRPNARGYQWGGETYIPMGQGYLHLWAEGSYTDPFLFIKESPNWSFVRTFTELVTTSDIYYEWLGGLYGPDTVTAQLSAGYEVPQTWSVTLSYLFAARGEFSGTDAFRPGLNWGGLKIGERDLDTDVWVYEISREAAAMTAPHGIPEYINQISVRGQWHPFDWLELVAQPSVSIILNRNHVEGITAVGFEAALSARVELAQIWNVKPIDVNWKGNEE